MAQLAVMEQHAGRVSPPPSESGVRRLSQQADAIAPAGKANAEADRRARRSEIEKKSRQRRQCSVRLMRDELQQLEKTYLQLLANESAERGVILSPSEVQALRTKYLSVTSEANALREQQKQLQAMLHEKQLFRDSMRGLGSEFGDPYEAMQWHAAAHGSFEPLTMEQGFALMRESYETIGRFDVGGQFITSGASYFGWSDKRRLDEAMSCMHFSFTKTFEHQSTDRLMNDSWQMYHDQAAMRALFPPSVRVNLEVLQVINKDVCVVRRHTHYAAMNKSFHTVYLLFRLETAAGYTICFRTIPAPGIQQTLEENDAWIDIFHWTHMNNVRDANGDVTGCEIVFGGSLGGGFLNFAMHWMIQLILTVVRWENSCVAPMFITSSS